METSLRSRELVARSVKGRHAAADRPAEAGAATALDFFALPPGLGAGCVRAWHDFVIDPPASRRLAREVFEAEGEPIARALAGICLAYHHARAGEVADVAAILAVTDAWSREAGDERASRLGAIIAAYAHLAGGAPERAVAALEGALSDMAQQGSAPALDRFLACHALALAHARLGRLDQVLHHHYANLLLLEPFGAASPLAIVLLNLSSSLTAIDDWEEALELARRAIEFCGRMRNAALKRRCEINAALALRFLGRLEEALELLARLRGERYRDPGSDFALFINSAEALAQAGRIGPAARCLERARRCASPAGDPHERANLAWIDGLLTARAGRHEQARSKLEEARRQAVALRKVHVPLLPRIVQALAECHAQAGDPRRAFDTYREFHEAFEARLGYTTRARYSSHLSRSGAEAIDAASGPAATGAGAPMVDRARLNEALRRTLAAATIGTALAGWEGEAIERISSEARGLGVGTGRVADLVSQLRHAQPASLAPTEEQTVRACVLGEFELRVRGNVLRFGRKRPERPLALCRYLASCGTRGASEAEVADALWPDLEGDAAMRALAVNLHRLRHLLEDNDAVVRVGRRLALAPRNVWCDATMFEHLLDRSAAAEDEAEREGLADRALALYGGDLVADADREPWALAARNRLRGRYLLACAGRGARLAAAGRWQEARERFAQGLQADPAAEELCLGLLRACAALGQREEGIAAYHRHQAALAAAGRGRPAAGIDALYRVLAGPG